MSGDKVTIRRIAEALGISARAANLRASTQSWPSTEVSVRGGRQRLYAPADLPGDVRDALVAHGLRTRIAAPESTTIITESMSISSTAKSVKKIDMTPPALADEPHHQSLADLKGWQSDIMNARLTLVREVERLSRLGGKMRAIETLVAAGNAGGLAPELQSAAARASAKKGSRSPLSATTLRRWVDDFRAAEGNPIALAPDPSPREQHLPPEWLADFLDFYARPGKPSVVIAARACAKERPSVALPPIRTIQHHVAKMPAIERARRRMGPRALRQLKAFVRRDVSDLWPTAVYVTDGHTHHAQVQHPLTGRQFRPEVTSTIDVVTRRLVGWSTALSENTWGTIDALRHAFTTSGVPDIWYVDNGSGFNNVVFDDTLVGLLARFDVEKHNRLPYRSQAGGVIERFHKVWIEEARLLPSYVGVDMDPEARKRVDTIVATDVEVRGSSPLLQSWPDFISWMEEQAAAYNDRPHSSLPKIVDATGKRRNMSPNEAWAAWAAQGWSPDVVEADDADFRPQEKRRVLRAEIQLFTNRYFAIELEEFHECDVLVAYDIHDASRVWVSTLDRRFIAVATYFGNSVSFFPRSVAEQAHEKRVENRLKRNDRKREAIAEEGRASVLTLAASNPDPVLASIDVVPVVLEVVADSTPPSGDPERRPNFADDVDMARWLMARPARITPHDARHLMERLRASIFRLRLEADGLDPVALRALLKPLTPLENRS